MTAKPFEIRAARFTATEVAEALEFDRRLLEVWIHRGVIVPTRPARGRPLFSIVGMFEAKLIYELGRLGIGPAVARDVLRDDWMYAVARSVEKNTGLQEKLMVALAPDTDCWRHTLHTVGDQLEAYFGLKTGFVVLPIGAMFASVYKNARLIDSGQQPEGQAEKSRRGKA